MVDAASPGVSLWEHCSRNYLTMNEYPASGETGCPRWHGPWASSRDLGHVCGLASHGGFHRRWCWAVIIVFLPEVCSVDCGTHGVCIGGACRCEEGWTGAACDQRVCHPRCIEHGTCKDGKCECREGWNGEHCTIGRQTAGTETGTYCFIFINRRSIVMVVRCNRLFPQGHNASCCLSNLPGGIGKGKAWSGLEKIFPASQNSRLGGKGPD